MNEIKSKIESILCETKITPKVLVFVRQHNK